MSPSLSLLSRPGPALIASGLSSLAMPEAPFRDFSTKTFLNAFAPDPSTGTLRVPFVTERERNDLRVGLLSDAKGGDFVETVERLLGDAYALVRDRDLRPDEPRKWKVLLERDSTDLRLTLRSQAGRVIEVEKSGDLDCPWTYRIGSGWWRKHVTAVQYVQVDHGNRISTESYELTFKGQGVRSFAESLGYRREIEIYLGRSLLREPLMPLVTKLREALWDGAMNLIGRKWIER